MSDISIGRHKYTATYLDDYSSFGVIFYLKKNSDEFSAFKQYKAWAKRQLDTTLKCRRFDQGGEFLSNEQKTYMIENGIEVQTSMPDNPQQNGQAERFQQTIINGAEAMRHHAGLSNSFWIYVVKAKLHALELPRTSSETNLPRKGKPQAKGEARISVGTNLQRRSYSKRG